MIGGVQMSGGASHSLLRRRGEGKGRHLGGVDFMVLSVAVTT